MKDRVYFLAPTCVLPGWHLVTVEEHGPHHGTRPSTWKGPYASALSARAAAVRAGLVVVDVDAKPRRRS